MKFPLHGNDIDETTNPLEAGLGWVVKPAKGDFIGRAAIEALRARGVARKLVGFEMVEPSVPRHGYRIGVPAGGHHSAGRMRPFGVSGSFACLSVHCAAAATRGR